MGVWGTGPFENDAALDWLETLRQSAADGGAGDCLRDAIESLADPALGMIEADEACAAVAAAETVAALLGRPAASLPAPVAAWLEGQRAALHVVAAALRPTALATLSRVKSASELRDLAEGADAVEMFEAAIDELHERLRAAGTPRAPESS